MEAVKKLHCHPTADEIYAAVKADYPNISRATVYRNLKLLAEAGEIGEVEMPGGADHFDYQTSRHYHVRCTRCGRIFDVDMEYIPDLEKSIKNTQGFQLNGHDIIFKGICPECLSESAHTGA